MQDDRSQIDLVLDEEDKVVKSLAKHGLFFHRAVLKYLLGRKYGNQDGPMMVTQVNSEFPFHFNGGGSVDILVRADFSVAESGDRRVFQLTLPMELKKTYVEANAVVFTRIREHRFIKLLSKISYNRSPDGGFASEFDSLPFDVEDLRRTIVDDGLWVEKKTNRGEPKASPERLAWDSGKDKIYEALNQVCRGLHGVMANDSAGKLDALQLFGFQKPDFYLPVIVTNAPLYVADSLEDEQTLVTGEPREVALTRVSSVFFLHSFSRNPSDARDQRNNYGDFSNDDPDFERETVLILNSSALEELFDVPERLDSLANVVYRVFHPMSFGPEIR